jgi:phosphopantothenoylcysteine decarboxylase/phosphopantothenate--cysteine ligase
MGVAVARRAAARGADVTLVAGPLKVPLPQGVRHLPVRTAQEMYDRVLEVFPVTDVVVKAAAVADIRPERFSQSKIKKEKMASSMTFVRNPDILKKLGELRRPNQILVGFAAETQEVLKHGRAKLKKKNIDLLVPNDVSQQGAGFDYDTNIVRLLHRSGKEEQLDLMPKDSVADIILDRVKEIREEVRR